MQTIDYKGFIELSSTEYEEISGGFGIVMTVAAWAILGTFYVAPVAVVAGSYVADQYKKAAEDGARRGTVDAYNDWIYENSR